MTSRVLRRGGWNTVGIALFVVMVFPVFWMISTAFKPDDQINSLTPTWFSAQPDAPALRATRSTRRSSGTDVKNSVIIVLVTVAISMVLAFLAAVALAKYRFTGRKLFIVLMIGIQMLPGAGLIIPLYVVLARYHQVDTLTGVIVTYMTFALPFSVWTLRGFILGDPEGARGGGDGRRLDAARRVRPDPAAARRARARRDVGLRVHHELERVHLRPHPPERPGASRRSPSGSPTSSARAGTPTGAR